MEEIELKNSRSAHVGHLTRLYNEGEKLIMSNETKEQIENIQDKIHEQFRKLEDVHYQYFQSLSDKNDNSNVKELMERDETGKNEMLERLKAYLESCDKCENDNKADDSHSDIASARSIVSNSSERLREAKIKRKLEELKMQQLLEFQRIEDENRALDKQKQLKVQLHEIERSVLEESLWEDEVKDTNVKLYHNTLEDKGQGDNLLNSISDSGRKQLELDVKAKPFHPTSTMPTYSAKPMTFRPPLDTYGYNPGANQPDLKQFAPDLNEYGYTPVINAVNKPNDAYEQTAKHLSILSESVSLPKPELLHFSGDSKDYFRFITNFEVNLANKLTDNRLKLSYLIQHCSGEAKSIVENCVLLEPSEGYSYACKLLKERYGQPHIIARSYIDNLTSGLQLKSNDVKALVDLSHEMTQCEMTLSRLGYVSDLNSTETLRGIVKRLPTHIRAKWVESAATIIVSGTEPKFKHLCDFIKVRARVASTVYGQELAHDSRSNQRSNVHGITRKPTPRVTTLVTNSENEIKSESKNNVGKRWGCNWCNESHFISNCEKFKKLSLQDKGEFIKRHKLCFNCLCFGHIAKGCLKPSQCNRCKSKHHVLVHSDTYSREKVSEPNSSSNINEQVNDATCQSAMGKKRICMQVVPVRIKGKHQGQYVETYALLDSGSDSTLCNLKLLNQLGIDGVPQQLKLNTANGTTVRNAQRTQMYISSLDGRSTVNLKRVLAVDDLKIPNVCVPNNDAAKAWSHLNDLHFPEIESEGVMLIIGSDQHNVLIPLEVRTGNVDDPVAIRTVLGWTLMGSLDAANLDKDDPESTVNFQQAEIMHQLEKLWMTDFADTALDEKTMSMEDKRALEKMEASIQQVNGKYELAMPFKKRPVVLPNNRYVAESRLRMLKRKLQGDESLFRSYVDTIEDYLIKGYARKVDDPLKQENVNEGKLDTDTNCVWYLPHHPVLSKPGKVRIVFDCAAQFQGKSLNDHLLSGPDLMNSLVGVLIRFRQEHVALVSDIEAMFNQVKVTQEDCNFLRFLWWPNGEMGRPPEEYYMTVHLFGATSSPSCSAFCLRKTAEDNKEEFSEQAVQTVLRNFYVDDCLKSVPTVQNGIELARELSTLLRRGGFHLTKWNSNNKAVLDSIPMKERAPSAKDIEMSKDAISERVLGLCWSISNDAFTFSVHPKERPLTRRGILSVASSLYDPLGLVAPVTLIPKLLLQDLCRKELKWDDEIDEPSFERWSKWLNSLEDLRGIYVPRCLKISSHSLSSDLRYELHHFADASEIAYGAATYLKIYDEKEKDVRVSLIMGKSRLAPIKAMTIPRLELSAAVVAVRLHQFIMQEIDIKIDKCFFWTDSMSTLQYIRNESTRFKTFVANRLSFIREVTDPSDWYYIPTMMNPADLASRGVYPYENDKLKVWLSGPKFLETRDEYPKQPDSHGNVSLEIKAMCVNSVQDEYKFLEGLCENYSDWFILRRSVAWLTRFANYCENKYLHKNKTVRIGPITVNEMKKAANDIVICVQQTVLLKDILDLKNIGRVVKTSSLVKLCPIYHDGMLKVGGRLQNANMSDEAKHPIILPMNHHVTKLIIRSCHEGNGHVGMQQVLSLLRRNYWIIKGGSAVKGIIRKCFTCKRRSQNPCEQMMSPLPKERITPDLPPFSNVGIDYFGPFQVKYGRGQCKRYGCIFTCLASRAVHIEIAHSLDTDSFLAAFNRFEARRGRPLKVCSDNGTNLTSGDKELKEGIRKWNQHQIHKKLLQKEIEWKFNPPSASHMGGIWERMIRSTRRILRALVKDQLLSDEALCTVMCEVEKILNDRPITVVGTDVNDPRSLTPSNLLLPRSNGSFPLGVFKKSDNYSKRWWRQVQYLSHVFWKRWIKEYVPTLQMRNKWLKPERNLKVDDIVLLGDVNVPRGQWPLARVVEVFPGRDGFVRSVKLKVGDSFKVRPITKVCLLEQAA